ncbi:YihY/virulence factor BrkB family protein [Ammonicoccus fulvus]|uniref:YihY/virulence factor BrkB family protein n=1 Tax=Ammonicoccus fulvus TaxID=3138240 RepID=A0ABZ3FSR4_9ACTN
MLWHTAAGCLRYRVTGLAAEVAFFALLSLPPLVFGLVGSIGFIARRFTVSEQGEFRSQVLILANRFLTPDTVADIIAPTLDEVLLTSRFEIVSIGFVIALWSGSRAMAVFVDAITIMYGLHGERGILKTRALSFGVYLGFMVGGAIILPVVVAGPRLVDQLLPDSLELLSRLYWPIVLLAGIAVLASLLHWATPVRNRWRSHVPGAALTVLAWIVGSAVLRWVLLAMTGSTSIFGPLATPIALILWLYLIAIAVLIGGALNAALAKEWPRFAGISPAEADHVLDALDEEDQLDNNDVKDSPERP